MYMGEIVRLTLERLTMEGLLFSGVDRECELFVRGRFYTKYVSEIERLAVYQTWNTEKKKRKKKRNKYKMET